MIAEVQEEIARGRERGTSERQATRQFDVPRSTFRYWQQRFDEIDAPLECKQFFECPQGQLFLHRLLMALHLVMELVVGGGIRPVILILELVGLTSFVAGSIGTHSAIAREIEQQVACFGREERARLAQHMPHKDITLCQDETFHPQPCLVAIEPVSNFVVAEKYTEQRDARTWDQTIDRAIEGLPVTVFQSTSDEAKGILAHAKKRRAHHSPDLFHVQHEACGATSLALSHQVKAAEQAVIKAQEHLHKTDSTSAHVSTPTQDAATGQRSNPSNADARAALVLAKTNLEQAREHQVQCREAIRGLGRDYHPVDLRSGEPRSAEQLADKLEEHFNTLETIGAKASLSESSLEKLRKARRQLPAMKATIAFFHQQLDTRIDDLGLSPVVKVAMNEFLVPAAYLERVANRASLAEQRMPLRDVAHTRRSVGYQMLDDLGVSNQIRPLLETLSATYADLFQRSSSCVEGRNGQLSLRHHHLHCISEQRLEALTVIHNYMLKRPDGTTAAERFFGTKPNDLFEHLLSSTRLPPRPAAKRSASDAMLN